MPVIRRSLKNPFTGGEAPVNPGDAMIGMPMAVAGLPEGLNPGAIEEMLKQLGLDVGPAEETIQSGVRRVGSMMQPTAARMQELLAKFGGLAK